MFIPALLPDQRLILLKICFYRDGGGCCVFPPVAAGAVFRSIAREVVVSRVDNTSTTVAACFVGLKMWLRLSADSPRPAPRRVFSRPTLVL